MAITGTQVITDRARYLLNDTGTSNVQRRWQDTELIAALNDVVRYIWDHRPDARYDSTTGALLTLTEISVIGGTLSIADKYRGALAYGVAGIAFAMPGQQQLNLPASRGAWNSFFMLAGLPGPATGV